MIAFYNEINPYAAAWLRNLIAAGHIAHGVVDERSIEDINPEELLGYTQCHFFSGIGVWSYALRRAGWPDDRPVWTGSCPCQPFSAAGKGAGADDLRHLWPAWHHLIAAVRPPVVFGEQVEAAIRHGWLDLVQADLEGIGYAFGAAGLPAAGVGAPHIRQRLWFVAQSNEGEWGSGRGGSDYPSGAQLESAGRGASDPLAHHHHHQGLEGGECAGERTGIQRQATERGGEVGCVADPDGQREGAVGRIQGILHQSESSGVLGGVADDQMLGRPESTDGREPNGLAALDGEDGRLAYPADGAGLGSIARPTLGVDAAPVASHWADCDWIPCRDGKWRPVEPGTFPLAPGAPSRVGRLRAYGNAIVAPCAEAFIRSAVEAFELKDMLS